MMSGTNVIGLGIYTPAEAAYYARVSTQTMIRWVHGSRAGDPVLCPQLEGDPERTVTFLDLIQALAVRAIRREHKIPLQKIRDAVNYARERYDVPHPLAMHHKTFLFGQELLIELPARLTLVQISGKQKDQLFMREIAEPYMQDLSFSGDDVAIRYRAFEHGQRAVVIDPARRLGQPIIEPLGHSVDSLLAAYRSEASARAAAEAYGVEEDDVLFAIRYDDYLQGAAAA